MITCASKVVRRVLTPRISAASAFEPTAYRCRPVRKYVTNAYMITATASMIQVFALMPRNSERVKFTNASDMSFL